MLKQKGINLRSGLAFCHDAMASMLAFWLAYWLRFNLEIPKDYQHHLVQVLIWAVPLQSFIFWRFGLYRSIWRYASLPDLRRIVTAIMICAMATPLLLVLLRLSTSLPRSVLVLDPILLVLIMGGSRLAYRAWKEHRVYGLLYKQGEPVLVMGAGATAVSLVKELERSREWRAVGLLDDDATNRGKLLQGVKVLGALDDLPYWAGRLSVQHAIIAMPSESHLVRRHAAEICTEAGINVLTVPSYDDLMSGKVTVSQIRKIELDDLLGRDPVMLNMAALHGFLDEQVAMVTGAGGSIGSELCRQIAKFRPRLLILFDLNEFALYRMEQEFSESFPNIPVVCAIGDVKDSARIVELLRRYAPDVIFHAAAYKHVPLMEKENAWQAVKNNVLGTYILGYAAAIHGVKKFVMVSTDKAVNPTNVMGASKRLSEMICQSLQERGGTRFVMVRFGNVLGSAGSVIPKFQEQIARGGPVTVTHPEIIRYFMSIPEAAQLVLQAGLMGYGGEIFVLDMGEPVKIVDLARDMIKLSGFAEEEIRIIYTGLRPGEKLYEELLADDELTLPTPHPKLRIAQAREADVPYMDEIISQLSEEDVLDDSRVRVLLRKWVPEYSGGQELTNGG